MVEDRVDNLVLKNLVEMKFDQSTWGEEMMVIFRRKLEDLLLAIAVNSYIASRYVTSKHVRIK